jgi:hypothetical protein
MVQKPTPLMPSTVAAVDEEWMADRERDERKAW